MSEAYSNSATEGFKLVGIAWISSFPKLAQLHPYNMY